MNRSRIRAIALGAAACCALFNSGCLAAAVGGCAAGAGVACNAYAKGKVCHLYAADLGDSIAAAKTALAEMGLPLEKEKVHADSAVLRTRTGDGDVVRIYLDRETSRIPADGAMTRIGVRVAMFGDHPLSERILYQIGAYLAPRMSPLPLPGPGPLAPVAATVAPPTPPPPPAEPPLAK